MAKEGGQYLAYLLRLWEAESEAGRVWRASVESPHTGEHEKFRDVEELFEFLRQRTGSSSLFVEPDENGPASDPLRWRPRKGQR